MFVYRKAPLHLVPTQLKALGGYRLPVDVTIVKTPKKSASRNRRRPWHPPRLL